MSLKATHTRALAHSLTLSLSLAFVLIDNHQIYQSKCRVKERFEDGIGRDESKRMESLFLKLKPLNIRREYWEEIKSDQAHPIKTKAH
jgi:hypothetical protein